MQLTKILKRRNTPALHSGNLEARQAMQVWYRPRGKYKFVFWGVGANTLTYCD